MAKFAAKFVILILVCLPFVMLGKLGAQTKATSVESQELTGSWTLRLLHMEQNVSASPDELVHGCWNVLLDEDAKGNLTGSVEKDGWRLPLVGRHEDGRITASATGAADDEQWKLDWVGTPPVSIDESKVTERTFVGTATFQKQAADSAAPIVCHGIAIKQTTPYPTKPISWELESLDGKAFSSQDLHGDPSLVIFSMGFSCAHCNDQIKDLLARSSSFDASGAKVLMIVADTKKNLTSALKQAEFPFTFLADPELRVFGKFGLGNLQRSHAAVVLDGNGVTQWESAGREPELDMDVLLNAIKRHGRGE